MASLQDRLSSPSEKMPKLLGDSNVFFLSYPDRSLFAKVSAVPEPGPAVQVIEYRTGICRAVGRAAMQKTVIHQNAIAWLYGRVDARNLLHPARDDQVASRPKPRGSVDR